MRRKANPRVLLILLLVIVFFLLISLSSTGIERAEAEKQVKNQTVRIETLEEVQKEFEDKLKKLEKDYQKLKISKALEKQQAAESRAANSSPQQPAVRLSNSSCETYRALVSQYNWNVDIVLQIMMAESGCNPNAISPWGDWGLLQLHGIPILDPAENIAYAYNEKYLKGGFSHWTVCTKGIVRCWN